MCVDVNRAVAVCVNANEKTADVFIVLHTTRHTQVDGRARSAQLIVVVTPRICMKHTVDTQNRWI